MLFRSSLKFSRPGTYAYYCIMHLTQGMIGTVEVLARAQPPSTPPPGPTPQPPATGTGTEAGKAARHQAPDFVLLALLAFGLLLVFRIAHK